MSANTVGHKQNTSVIQKRCPSPAIWEDCPVLDIIEGVVPGIYIDEEFADFPLIGTQTTEIGHGRWKVFNTGAGVIVPVTAINAVEKMGSYLSIGLDTDNDSGAIAQSYPSFMLSGLTANSGKLWFSVRFAMNTLLTNTMGFIAGLAETDLWTLATAVPFNAASATINNSASFLGFYKGEDALGVVDVVRSDRAVAWTTIKAAAGTLAAAYTFMEVGFVYDPELQQKCVKFFVDNVEQGTWLTNAALQAFTNLDANPLGIIVAAVADSAGTTSALYLDRIRCAQLYPKE